MGGACPLVGRRKPGSGVMAESSGALIAVLVAFHPPGMTSKRLLLSSIQGTLSQVALTDTSPLRSSWVPVEGLPIYTVVGGDGPPIVLVHGFGVSGGYMLPLARVLAETRSVLVPDLPGHGRSGRASGAWGIPEMARVLGTWL